MTRLEDGLRELAEDAPPLNGMAERALGTARRRRRIRIPVAAAAAVAVSGAIGLVATDLMAPNDGDRTITTTPLQSVGGEPETVHFPETADPLPAGGVGPATLTYRYDDAWRVMLADGTHYEVPDAEPEARIPESSDDEMEVHDPDPPPAGTLTVSPDGDRLGYLRTDGTFVLHDLASGEITATFEWDQEVFGAGQQEAVWSPDGRWLLVIPGPPWMAPELEECIPVDDGGCRLQPTNPLADPVLLDTESLETVDLPDTYNQLMGMTEGDALFPHMLGGVEDRGLPLFDHEGRERGEIPMELLPGRNNDGVLGNISPDGRTFAAITFASMDGDDPANILVVDVEGERLVDRFSLGGDWMDYDSPAFQGWVDTDSVMIQSGRLEPIQGGEEDWNTVRTVEFNLHLIDLGSGELTHIFRFPNETEDVVGVVSAVAYRAL